MEFKLLEALAAGGDLATMAIAIALFKLHTRLTRVEAKMESVTK